MLGETAYVLLKDAESVDTEFFTEHEVTEIIESRLHRMLGQILKVQRRNDKWIYEYEHKKNYMNQIEIYTDLIKEVYTSETNPEFFL